MKYDRWKQGRIFIFFSGGVGRNNSEGGGVVMIMCRGGSRVFDDRFTGFTQLIGVPSAWASENF